MHRNKTPCSKLPYAQHQVGPAGLYAKLSRGGEHHATTTGKSSYHKSEGPTSPFNIQYCCNEKYGYFQVSLTKPNHMHTTTSSDTREGTTRITKQSNPLIKPADRRITINVQHTYRHREGTTHTATTLSVHSHERRANQEGAEGKEGGRG